MPDTQSLALAVLALTIAYASFVVCYICYVNYVEATAVTSHVTRIAILSLVLLVACLAGLAAVIQLTNGSSPQPAPPSPAPAPSPHGRSPRPAPPSPAPQHSCDAQGPRVPCGAWCSTHLVRYIAPQVGRSTPLQPRVLRCTAAGRRTTRVQSSPRATRPTTMHLCTGCNPSKHHVRGAPIRCTSG